jgi:hypothetical protein
MENHVVLTPIEELIIEIREGSSEFFDNRDVITLLLGKLFDEQEFIQCIYEEGYKKGNSNSELKNGHDYYQKEFHVKKDENCPICRDNFEYEGGNLFFCYKCHKK